MHPHLNHLGADLSRGLLQFAEGRPLGDHGMFWLYVQAANLWGQGVDKLPLWGRHKWVEDHLAQIVGAYRLWQDVPPWYCCSTPAASLV
jgi:DNA-directed RNA polymerase